MSEILLIQHGHPSDTLVATSLIRKLSTSHRVHVITDEVGCDLLAYFQNVRAETFDALKPKKFDIAINLSPQVRCTELIDTIEADEKLGFGKTGESLSFYNKGAALFYRHRYIGVPTKSTLFQLMFAAAGETWAGEGYFIPYFPRNRTKKNSTGLAIRDKVLREYLSNNIQPSGRVQMVPLRTNLFKQIDELNRCSQIVTDDPLVSHLALALRKNVELIARRSPPYAVEMFGSGHLHVFDTSRLKEITSTTVMEDHGRE